MSPGSVKSDTATSAEAVLAGFNGKATGSQDVSGSLADVKNVVLLLADDLEWDTFNAVPRSAALKTQGTTLTHFVVTNSLCCPPRMSLLRGQYVRNCKLVSNVTQTSGGWETFYNSEFGQDCLPTWLQDAGVDTSLFGEYLNGFAGPSVQRNCIPPGWDTFVNLTSRDQSYKGYGYTLNRNGVLQDHGHAPPAGFLNDVLRKPPLAI